MTKQLEIPGSRFLHLKEPEVMVVELQRLAEGTRLAIMLQHHEQMVLITMTEKQASDLMGALEVHFCNDPDCERHRQEVSR